MSKEVKKLYRSRENRVIAGVCGGIGEYFGVDPTIVRLAWLLFIFAGGSGVIAYIIAALIIPERPAGEKAEKVKKSKTGGAEVLFLVLGLLLVVIGATQIMHNFFGFPWGGWQFFVEIWKLWPIALIVIGLLLIFGGILRHK